MGAGGSGDMLHLVAGPLLIEVRAGVEEGSITSSGVMLICKRKLTRAKRALWARFMPLATSESIFLMQGGKAPSSTAPRSTFCSGSYDLQLLLERPQVFFERLADLLVHRA